MNWTRVWLLLLSVHLAAGEVTPELARQALGARAAELLQKQQAAVKGSGGFFFLTSELRHYGLDQFWGPTAGPAPNREPLSALVDFHGQLKAQGIQLILVPVPGKVSVYPDTFDAAWPVGLRLDGAQQRFFAELRKAGLAVVDLQPEFLRLRQAGTETHCRTDSHWTPAAVRETARLIAAEIKSMAWLKDTRVTAAERTEEAQEFTGDLAALLGDSAKEKVVCSAVKLGGAPVSSDRQSPLVLMGDSHVLVYHQPIPGGIGALNSGLPDQLAAELGFAPDVVGVMGNGANAARINLARRKDNLAGKRAVVWCFTMRELSEAAQGWLKVPVIRPQ